jgi:hypothetical protein
VEEVSEVSPQRRAEQVRRRILVVVGAASLASFAFACAGIIGIDDRLPDEIVEEAAVPVDGAVPNDAPVAPGACPGTSKCVVVPDGWTLTSLAPAGRPGCSEGYGSPEDLVVASDGLGCTCTCNQKTPGSCAAAGATTTFRDYPSFGCSASTSTYPLTVLDGGCVDAAIPTTPAVRVPTAPSSPPTCVPNSGPTPVRNGQACAVQGVSCADGGICAGALPANLRLCIERDGDVACPTGYDKKYSAGPSASADTRKCGTCTCTPGSQCDSPILELFTGGACTNAKVTVPASGSCTATDAGITYNSYRYSGKAPGCQPSAAPLLDGGLTIDAPKTLCCEQRN